MAISIEQLNANRAKLGLPPLPDTQSSPTQPTVMPQKPTVQSLLSTWQEKNPTVKQAPQVSEKKGILKGVQEKRGGEVLKSIQAYQKGQQGLGSTIAQTAGQTLGGASDIIGGLIGKGLSAITPGFIEEPVKKAGTKALSSLMGTKPGQYLGQKMTGLEVDTTKTRNIKALLGGASFGLDVTGVGLGAKAGQRVVKQATEATGEALAKRAVKQLPKKIEQAEQKAVKLYEKATDVAKGSKKAFEEKFQKSIASYLVEEQVPLASSGNALDTKQAQKFVKSLINREDKELSKVLSTSDKQFSVNNLRKEAKRAIDESPVLASEQALQKNAIDVFLDAEITKRGSQLTAQQYNELKRRFNKFFDKADTAKNEAARTIQSIIRGQIENTFQGDEIIKKINQRLSQHLEAIKALKKMDEKVIKGGLLGKKLNQVVAAVALNKIPILGPILGYETAGRITDYLLNPTRLTNKAIENLQKLKIVPTTLKTREAVLDYLKNDLEKKLRGRGEMLLLPEARPGTPKGTIELPKRLRDISEVRSVPAQVSLPVPRPGQLMLPEKASPAKMITPPPTIIDKPSPKIGNAFLDRLNEAQKKKTANKKTKSSLVQELIRGQGKNDTGSVDLYGRGLYLTDSKDIAKEYGDKITSHVVSGKIFDATKPLSRKDFNSIVSGFEKKLNVDLSEYKTTYSNDIKLKNLIDEIDTNIEGDKISEWARRNGVMNEENSLANTASLVNSILKEKGSVGLKYSTDDIEDLFDKGLGGKNAFVIFDDKAIANKKTVPNKLKPLLKKNQRSK